MQHSRHCETARLVRHGRWVLGLSQEDFAARLGLDVTAVRALESGRSSPDLVSGLALAALAPGALPGAHAGCGRA